MTRVGITGHQRLEDPASWGWVTDTLRERLARLARPLLGLSSLAVGADQLFARLVRECGGSVRAVLPFANIERTLPQAELHAFRELLSHCEVEILEEQGNDEQSFALAFERILNCSDVIIAVWDPSRAPLPGGTAEAVARVRQRQTPLIHLDPATRVVRETSG